MAKSQKLRVYEYMMRNGTISQMEAFNKLNIVNLPGRIYDLKRDGVKIDKFHVHYKKKEGGFTDYDRFFVADDNTVIPTN